jgi:hypothetical protein
MVKESPTARRWYRRYQFELGGAMLVYVVTLMVCLPLAHSATDPLVRILLGLAPMIGMLLTAVSIVRLLRRVDEYQRQLTTESLAAAGGITALFLVACGLLETTGRAPVSSWWGWTVMGVAWLGSRWVLCRMRR